MRKRVRAEQEAEVEHAREQVARRAEGATKARVADEKRAARVARLDAEERALRDERAGVTASRVAVDAEREIAAWHAARRPD